MVEGYAVVGDEVVGFVVGKLVGTGGAVLMVGS
jgi:hypothetical protein